MIKVIVEDIPKEKEAKIRQWLTKPEASEFLEVVSSRAKAQMAAAINSAFESGVHNSKMEVAMQQVSAAQNYEMFCKIFVEYSTSPKPFNTVRLF